MDEVYGFEAEDDRADEVVADSDDVECRCRADDEPLAEDTADDGI